MVLLCLLRVSIVHVRLYGMGVLLDVVLVRVQVIVLMLVCLIIPALVMTWSIGCSSFLRGLVGV